MSNVSFHERASLQAQYKYYLDNYDCESKWFDYQERNNTSRENTEHYFKMSRGCFGGKIGSVRKMHGDNKNVDQGTIVGSLKYESCLCNYKHPLFDFIFTLFNQYDKFGTLPFEGSTAEQPAYIMECFSILSMVKSEHEYEQHKKQQK